jgi:hypothetical protein
MQRDQRTFHDYDEYHVGRRRVLLAGVVQIGFRILIYAIICGGLGALRGDNQTQIVYRQGSGITIAVLIPSPGTSANLPDISS